MIEFNSQNLFQVFPFLACSFSFCYCTFLDFGVVFLELPNPSVQARSGIKKYDLHHILILYLTKCLELKGFNSTSSFCSWGPGPWCWLSIINALPTIKWNYFCTQFNKQVTEYLPMDIQSAKLLTFDNFLLKHMH
jgi:hypothetical protein